MTTLRFHPSIIFRLSEVGYKHLYLHGVAEVSSGSDGHHGQEAGSGPDVQDDDPLAASLYSGYGTPDALIVLLILKEKKEQNMKHLTDTEQSWSTVFSSTLFINLLFIGFYNL